MDQYAVFGNPIAQSKSPRIHKTFARQTEQLLDYRAILAPEDGFTEALEAFFSDPDAMGCNVTMPFKEQAAAWVNELSPAAKLAGAVNTIIRKGDGQFVGDNTDGYGLVNDLLNNGVELENKNVLVLGAGGAVRGVILPLLEQQPSSVTIANRTVSKAQTIASLFSDKRLSAKGFTELDNPDLKFDVIINATSTSLHGELPAIPDKVYQDVNAVYDMVYQSQDTLFMQHANKCGVKVTIDGLGMLVGQAAMSFKIWRGVMPEVTTVLNSLRSEL